MKIFQLLPLAVIALLGLVPAAKGAIMSIDFGSNFVKVGMVQKGKPFHIVVDETSKRKSPLIVAFDDGARQIGVGGKSLAVRKPKRAFVKFRNLLGVSPNSPLVQYYKEGGYPHVFKDSPDGRGVISVDSPNNDGTTYSIEQLVAMDLEYIKKICEMDAEEPVVDAVISVPAYWNVDQRQAMLDAGHLAGLNVLSLVNENTAAAVQYGIDLNYQANMSEHVAIYNMGDSTTQVSVIKYSSYTKKRGLSNKTIGQLEVLHTATDITLGGDAFDRVIAKQLMEEFNQLAKSKGHGDYDISQSPKTMAKIQAAANKAKHVLSANQEVPIYIESLALDLDFKSHMTREKFYELAGDLLTRLEKPLLDALEGAAIAPEDLKTTIVIGGSVRIPAVQTQLKQTLKSEDALSFSLDGDESVALGAAFMAANMSTAFRVRPIGLIDRSLEPIKIDVDSPARDAVAAAGEEAAQEARPAFHKSVGLFKKGSKIGGKKKVTFRHDRDVTVKVAYETEAEAAETTVEEESGIVLFNVTGVERAIEKVTNRTEEKPKITLSFRLTSSGTVEMVDSTVSVQKAVFVKPKKALEKKKKNAKKDNLEDLLGQNKNFTRCESDLDDDEDSDVPNCAACTYYASTCGSFSKCTVDEQLKGSNDVPKTGLGMVLRLPLNDQKCVYQKAKDGQPDEDAGCYSTQSMGTQPCYAVAETEEESADESKDAGGNPEESQKQTEDAKEGDEKEKEGEAAGTGDGKSAADATAESAEQKKNATVETKLIWTRKPIRSSMVQYGAIKGLTELQISEEKAILKDLNERDLLKQKIAQAKNKVEAYVYAARGILRDEKGEEVTTEEEREELLAKLEGAEDWLYDQDEADDTLEKFEGKHRELRELMAGVEFRADEYEKRPEALEKCKSVIAESESWINTLKNRSWIKDTDVEGLQEKVTNFINWVEEAEAKQTETPLTEAPYFNSSTAIAKLTTLVRAAEKLLAKKKPKAPPKPLDYVRCESGKNKTACGRCTHYASSCYSFDTCKSNSTRYALYGKSKCTYNKAESGCFYSVTKDAILGYPCFKGVPKKKASEGSESQNKTETEVPDGSEAPEDEGETQDQADGEEAPSEDSSSSTESTEGQEKASEPSKDEL